MSKCSVLRTWKSNFLYWTLFCPKYCAEAWALERHAISATNTPPRRTRGSLMTIAAASCARRAPSAIGRRTDLDVGAIGAGGAIRGDFPFDLLTRGALGAAALGPGQRVEQRSAEIPGDQVLERDG